MATEDKRADPRAPFVLRVNFRDRTDCLDATENLSRGGLFVQTSEREGLSYALLEAMAHGLAVITTDAPGNLDAVFAKLAPA